MFLHYIQYRRQRGHCSKNQWHKCRCKEQELNNQYRHCCQSDLQDNAKRKKKKEKEEKEKEKNKKEKLIEQLHMPMTCVCMI